MDLGDYNYYLPKKNLALKPAVPRDFSKIFVYDTVNNQFFFDQFLNLDKYLPKNSFLVLNNTKVLPARVVMKKKSGGKVVALFLVNEIVKENEVKILADRKIKVADKLSFDDENFIKIKKQEKNIFLASYSFAKEKLFFLLQKYGSMPIPLYLKKTPLKKDDLLKKYQTIFAQKQGSSAAPTASLHFTNRVFKKLEKKGIEKYFVSLHVGLGTFAPITEENLKSKRLHKEYYEVEKDIWKKIVEDKKAGKKLVAVGTTVVRTIESEARQRNFYRARVSPRQNRRGPLESEKITFASPLKKTNLFIFPPFDFQMVDILITNFHLPKSSLMMLVQAFLEYKKAKKSLVELYNIAIKNNFRFYSFGDAMIIK